MKRTVVDLMSQNYHEVYQNLKKLANERKRRNRMTIDEIEKLVEDTGGNKQKAKKQFQNVIQKQKSFKNLNGQVKKVTMTFLEENNSLDKSRRQTTKEFMPD